MSHSVHVFNQFVWLLAMIATLGLIVFAWKRPVEKCEEAAAELATPSASIAPQSELMIIHVRKFHHSNVGSL